MLFKSLKPMFEYVWETREHRSEITGEPLLPKGHFKWHFQMMHLLSKNTYPHYKFESDCIILGLPEEHDHQNEYPIFNQRRDELRERYRLEYETRPSFT